MNPVAIENKELFCLPWTQTILGTHFNGKPNFMALDWVTRVNYSPAMLGACVNKGHASAEAILATGEFSVNVPGADMIGVTDYVGIASARREDKSGLFEVWYGALKAAPLIKACPIAIECKVTNRLDHQTNFFFIAEMLAVHAHEGCLTDGAPDAEKYRPFVLTMPDNAFWTLGARAGRAWKDGAAFREKLRGK